MPNLNSAGIAVNVGGVASNTLPFTIDNTAADRIRFIDEAHGDDTWDGKHATHGAGSAGPWKSAFDNKARDGVAPGAFIYMRGGTYTNIMREGFHSPRGAAVGACEQPGDGSHACNCYIPHIDGTDSLRITQTSYPGELAHFFNSSITVMSSYWTFANFEMDADLTYQGLYVALSLGNEWGHCTDCNDHTLGLQLIGAQFAGNLHVAIHTFGDNHKFVANHINTIPTAQGMGIDHSDPVYISSGDNILFQNNEVHGGSMWCLQHYDESRCNGGRDVGRGLSNVVIDSNWFDMDRAATSPYPKAGAVLTGTSISGGFSRNIVISNNLMTCNDGLASQAAIRLHDEASVQTVDGIHIHNNTIHNVPEGIRVFYEVRTTFRDVDVKNNIFSSISGYHYNYDSSTGITPVWSYNLTDKAASFNGPVTNNGNNVVGDPLFTSVATKDYSIQESSPAKDKGATLSALRLDYAGVPRPQGAAYDIGAYEYSPKCTTGAECTTPPICHVMAGATCPAGTCIYRLASAAEPCSTGNPCTTGEHCDGQGTCLPGTSLCAADAGAPDSAREADATTPSVDAGAWLSDAAFPEAGSPNSSGVSCACASSTSAGAFGFMALAALLAIGRRRRS